MFYYLLGEMIVQKAIYIYNPLSGQRSLLNKLDYIVGRFMEKDILLQPFRLTDGCEENLVEVLKTGGYSFAVISGGDGTLNSIVNCMIKNDIHLPLGFIPSGTCNDFARSLNIPNDVAKCLDIILGGQTIDIDIGLVNEEKYFLGTCAGGLFVDVSYNTSNEMKKNLGPLAYYLKALTEVANIKPIHLKIDVDGSIIEQDFLIFLVLNGKHAAGFSNVHGDADISDGLMDIILVKNCLHIDLVGMLFKALKSDLIKDKNVLHLRAKECTITGDSDIVLSVDGEKWEKLPVSIRFIHRALKVFVKQAE